MPRDNLADSVRQFGLLSGALLRRSANIPRIGLLDPYAFKIPARQGGIPLNRRSFAFLIFTLNQHTNPERCRAPR
jgi:hypothetical protein